MSTISCQSCGADVPSDAKFCDQCGAKTEPSAPKKAHCTECGAANDAGAKFCNACGHGLQGQSPARPAPRPRRERSRAPESAPRRASKGDDKTQTVMIIAAIALVGSGIAWYLNQNQTTETTTHAPATVNHDGHNHGPTAAAQDPNDIVGSIIVPDEIKANAPAAGTYYLMARAPGQTGGPPLAVVKIDNASTDPTPFVIGKANLMMGQGEFSEPVELSVRWDQDGDPMTKQPGDMMGKAVGNPVKPASTGVRIVIDSQLQEEGEPGTEPTSAPAAVPDPEQDNAGNAPAAPGAKVVGTIKIGDAVKGATPQQGVIFLIARRAGALAGPPLAVTRIEPNGSSDVAFTLGSEHMMMGGEFNQPVNLSVRWDQDGNAISKQPGDLTGKLEREVKPGESGVEIVLDTKL